VTKMLIDLDLCEGHGECVLAAPDLFALDDAGEKAVLLREDVPHELMDQARDAVAICPIVVLRLES
jgi:ferredoxin